MRMKPSSGPVARVALDVDMNVQYVGSYVQCSRVERTEHERPPDDQSRSVEKRRIDVQRVEHRPAVDEVRDARRGGPHADVRFGRGVDCRIVSAGNGAETLCRKRSRDYGEARPLESRGGRWGQRLQTAPGANPSVFI
jgi:hypothetical protein